jgi:hypothetical protein
MFVVKAYEPTVTLHQRDGGPRLFVSKFAALRQLGIRWIANNVAADFSDAAPTAAGWRFSRSIRAGDTDHALAQFIMRDESGNTVTLKDFLTLYPKLRGKLSPPYCRLIERWNGTGPVPGTGRLRGPNYFRSPRTFNELRFAASVAGEPPARAKRHRVPTDRDDLCISSRRVRSWKRHRARQWKG